MNKHIPKFVLLTIVVVVLQVWLFNPMAIYRVATPYVYPLLWLFLPIGLGRSASLLVGFALGLLLDYLSLTPGLHCSVMTFLGLLRPWMLRWFVQADISPSALPIYATLGKRSVVFFVLFTAIHHLVLYGLDALTALFSSYALLRMGAGYVLTLFVSFIIISLANLQIHAEGNSYGK